MLQEKGHIVLICSRLDTPGGIERATVAAANLFYRQGHAVTIIIADQAITSFYPIDPGIATTQLNIDFGIGGHGNKISRKLRLLKDVSTLKKQLRALSPAVIIATEYPFAVAVGMIRSNAIRISWEHHHHAWLPKNRSWNWLIRRYYPRMDFVVCLNADEQKHFEAWTNAIVIPNFVEQDASVQAALNTKTLLSVGWLIPRKGADLFLPIAREVLERNPGWTWKWIGTGEMEQGIRAYIAQEGLQQRIILQAPVSSDLQREYLQSSLFVLMSRFEAFPMVLLEAMALGVPCVSFDCPSGPSAIIQHGVDGMLVEKENVQAMTDTIDALLKGGERLQRFGHLAHAHSARFSPEAVYAQWARCFT